MKKHKVLGLFIEECIEALHRAENEAKNLTSAIRSVRLRVSVSAVYTVLSARITIFLYCLVPPCNVLYCLMMACAALYCPVLPSAALCRPVLSCAALKRKIVPSRNDEQRLKSQMVNKLHKTVATKSMDIKPRSQKRKPCSHTRQGYIEYFKHTRKSRRVEA